MSKYIGGYGPSGQSAIMIVGAAPTGDDEKSGLPLSGQVGSALAQDLREAGADINNCYRTNVFKYRLPNNEFKKYKEMGMSLEPAIKELQDEVVATNPNIIIGLDDAVLTALAGKSGKNNGINTWRGSILNTLGRKTIFTYSPARQLHGESGEGVVSQYKPWQKYVRKFDIQRAVKQSLFSEFRLPQRLLHIANSSYDLYSFLERNKHRDILSVDIESIECIPVCVGLSFEHHEAISVPLWNLLSISSTGHSSVKKDYNYQLEVSKIPTGDLANIWKILSKVFIDKKIKVIGQNFKYDEEKLNRLGFYFSNFHADIMLLQYCSSPEVPKSQAFMTSIWTEEPYYKNEGKEFNPKRDRIADLLLYNAKDAAVAREIYDAQIKELESINNGIEHALNFRSKLHKVYLGIEKIGFKVDTIRHQELIRKYTAWLIRLENEAFNIYKEYGITEPINLRSNTKEVPHLIYEVMKVPRRQGVGEDVLTSLLGNVVKKPDIRQFLNILLDYRRVDKTIGTYLAAETDYDGRMKTSYFISGTETYRTSTQVMKQPVRPKEIGWAIQTVTKHGDVGEDLRSYLIADKGYIFVNVDQAQAEPRVCSLLADDMETLKMLDTIDVHGLTAANIFGGAVELYDKKVVGFEKPERFIGKTGRNAYNLGVGKHQLMVDVNTKAKKYKIDTTISEWRANEILKVLYKMTPKIVDVYHATIQELLGRNKRIYGTFNTSRYFFDDDYGRELFKQAYAYIPQQTVSDNTKRLALKINKEMRDVFIVAETHDALTLLMLEKKLDDYMPQIKEWQKEPISFQECSIVRPDLVIPWDAEIGYDYKELNKYKGKK